MQIARKTIHVCLVDDDEDDYIITRDLLDQSTYFSCKIEWLSSYEAALARIADTSFDICLFDYRLGAHSGLDLLREMVARHLKTPVIVLTGLGDHDIDTEVMEAGGADFLNKGKIDAVLLERSIRYALDRFYTLEKLRESERSLIAIKEDLEIALSNINDELNMARQVQKHMLPQLGPMKGIDMAAAYIPCGTVGGDLYSFAELGDGYYGLLIFDVSGHGVPAAMLSAMAKISFDRNLKRDRNLVEVFQRVNIEITQSFPPDRYLTALVCLLDTNRKEFVYATAAHPPAQLLHKGATDVAPLSTSGQMIGFFPNAKFEQKTLQVSTGDRIAFFTDGLIETISPQGELFGLARLQNLIVQTATITTKEAVERISREAKDFAGKDRPLDDITLIMITIL